MSSRQLEFEWSISSMRSLLTRAAKALEGRSISLNGDSKSAVGGATLAQVMQSVFAWSLSTVTEGGKAKTVVTHTRGRPVEELAPGLSLRAKRGALAVLKSAECRGCVQSSPEYRLGHSPAVDLWISWPLLAEFVELLERSPRPKRTRKRKLVETTVQQFDDHGAAESEPRCSSSTVQGAAAARSSI